MDKGKILYVITKSVWGGAQKYVYDLATNLPKDRFEVTIAAGGNGLLFEKLQKAGARTITIPGLERDINIWKELKSLYHLFKIFREEKPDVIHLNSSKIGGLGALAAFVCKLLTLNFKYLNVIFTVHGWGFKEDRAWWQKTVIFFLSWFSSLFHDKIILINTADYCTAQRFIPKRKLAMIPNGVRPIDFLPRIEARAFFSKKIGRQIQKDEILIGTITELTKNKGINYLIDSTSLIINSNFLILIVGDGELHQELESRIKNQESSNKIFLTGFLPDASRYLKAFDIFVLPSLKEGLPYVIMEAMTAGLPLVATNIGGIPDLIQHGKNGLLVSPKDPSGIARAITDISKDEKLRSNFSKASLKIIKTKFSLNGMVQKTISLYV